MTTQNDTAQAMGEAAALPSATKTEARTARPATETNEKAMQTTEKRVNTWTPKSAIFGDDAARVLGAEEGGRHGTR